MKRIILLLIVLFVVAGCAQQAVQQESEPEVEEEIDITPDVIEVEEKDTSVLSEEIKDAIDSQLTPGVKVVFPLRYTKLGNGEKFTFGFGVQNTLNKDSPFRVDVYFDKAHDKMMNPIPTDDDTMNIWIKTHFEDFTIAKNGKETISIVMEVGDTRPGIKAAPGSYVFDIETFYADNGVRTNDEYVGKMELTLKVE